MTPSIESLTDALDHIMRVARDGIQPTRRLDWIELRSRYALEGKEWSRDIRETPKNSRFELLEKNKKLRDKIKEFTAQTTEPQLPPYPTNLTDDKAYSVSKDGYDALAAQNAIFRKQNATEYVRGREAEQLAKFNADFSWKDRADKLAAENAELQKEVLRVADLDAPVRRLLTKAIDERDACMAVVDMVLDYATCHTPSELIEAARAAKAMCRGDK